MTEKAIVRKIQEDGEATKTDDALFDIQPAHPGKTCKTCKHRMVIQYSKHAYLSYCAKIPSRKTANGWLKIKSKNAACYRYESED